jgi:hypothetical protein
MVTSIRSSLAATVAAGLLLLLSCDLFEATDENDGALEPGAMQDFLETSFPNVPNLTEALQRLVLTASGSPQPGVNLIPTATGAQGTLDIDFDGDGIRERTVAGRITLNDVQAGIAGGGTLQITGMTGGSSELTASTQVQQVGSSTLSFGPGNAVFRTAGGTDVAIPDMSFTVQQGVSGPIILGYMDFAGGDVSGTMLFESSGSAGWRIRVTSPDFNEFTVP